MSPPAPSRRLAPCTGQLEDDLLHVLRVLDPTPGVPLDFRDAVLLDLRRRDLRLHVLGRDALLAALSPRARRRLRRLGLAPVLHERLGSGQGLEQGQADELQEAFLRLPHVARRRAVAEGGDPDAEPALLVALLEELLGDPYGPPSVNVPRQRGVADVRRLHAHPGHEGPVCGGEDVELGGVQPDAEPSEHLEVLGHVRGQDEVNDLRADALPVILAELF
mmetsp:Transcript_86930/g.226849  ORF Transcript_86930/g.226849 Transcript_86930/m.226849 type:complete len:220 (+) Transcript_86930:266-925(+)